MIMNGLNGAWLDTSILNIIIEQEFIKSDKAFAKSLILKT